MLCLLTLKHLSKQSISPQLSERAMNHLFPLGSYWNENGCSSHSSNKIITTAECRADLESPTQLPNSLQNISRLQNNIIFLLFLFGKGNFCKNVLNEASNITGRLLVPFTRRSNRLINLNELNIVFFNFTSLKDKQWQDSPHNQNLSGTLNYKTSKCFSYLWHLTASATKIFCILSQICLTPTVLNFQSPVKQGSLDNLSTPYYFLLWTR